MKPTCEGEGDLGDLVVLLLAGSMAGLRDHLYADGFPRAGDLVADLVDIADHYVAGIGSAQEASR